MDLELIKKRLENFGYEYKKDKDKWVLESFLIPKVTDHIKNETNQDEIPEGLINIAVDMVVGEFLFSKKNSGQFSIQQEAVEKELAKITEGDVSYEYVNTTNAQSNDTKLDTLFNYLMHGHDSELTHYRKLRW